MRAIITGSASGIGKAVAKALATGSGRADLLLVDIAKDKLANVALELQPHCHRVDILEADLSLPADIERIADVAKRSFGGLDAIVSNAGIIRNGPLTELSLDDYESTFSVNTRATWLLAKASYPLLKEAKGAIVATASVSASQPTPPHGAYSASKAALAMLIRQMAYEFGPDGIRCNCVSPGTIHTELSDAVYGNPILRAEREKQLPLRRVGIPSDVAAAVAFLVSPAAGYITGIDLIVDGGLSTTLMPAVRKNAVPG